MFHPSAKAADLPARIDILEPDEYLRYFMDAHFHWCLNVHFHGGNMEDEKTLSRYLVRQFMDKLRYEVDDPEIPAEGKLKKEDWETQLGKGILEFQVWKDPKFVPTWPDIATAEDSDGDKSERGN
uniref:Uncharacterized protein n=1 Tax=Ganoderma boninense TaxID=34458 RepID=A0A5K1K6F9_9APHY|nr:Uncharacterized protein [Ganoderma boninense]